MRRQYGRFAGRRPAWGVVAVSVLLYGLFVGGCAGKNNAAPAAPEPQAFTFAVMGDLHIETGMDNYFVEVREDINKTGFFIAIGDLVPGYTHPVDVKYLEAEWDVFGRAMAGLTIPWYALPGNHDVYDPVSSDLFQKRVGPLWGSFDHGGCHFIMLCTEPPAGGERLGEKQLAWLTADLDTAGNRRTFVFMHKPLWRMGSWWRETIHPLLRKHNIHSVYAGHDHRYVYEERDGILYILTGGGAPHRTCSDALGGFQHFMGVTVDRDRVDLAVVTRDGRSPYTCEDGSALKTASAFARSLLPAWKIDREGQGWDVTVKPKNPYNETVTGRITFDVLRGSPFGEFRNLAKDFAFKPGETQEWTWNPRFADVPPPAAFDNKWNPWVHMTMRRGGVVLFDSQTFGIDLDVWPYTAARLVLAEPTADIPLDLTAGKHSRMFRLSNPFEYKISGMLTVEAGPGWGLRQEHITIEPFTGTVSHNLEYSRDGSDGWPVVPPLVSYAVTDETGFPVFSRTFRLTAECGPRLQAHRRELTAVKAERLPWPKQTAMVFHDGTAGPCDQTVVAAGWSAEGLTVSVECASAARPVTWATERDGDVQNDDAVELYLYRDGHLYVWAINAAGVLMDRRDGDTAWDSTLPPAVTGYDGHAWSAVFRIAWSDTGSRELPDEPLGFNIIRTQPRSPRGLSMWQPTFGRFDNPASLGILRLE